MIPLNIKGLEGPKGLDFESLNNSILISLDEKIFRYDIKFILTSRIDNSHIYQYIGDDFSTFDLKYTEVI